MEPQPIRPYIALGIILLIALGFLAWSAYTDGLIVDEQAHIPAGYAYLDKLDYRLNPEHPPLVKVLAAIPLKFLRPQFPDNRPSWQSEINSQWTVGDEFLFEIKNNPNLLIRLARIGPIFLTLLTILFLYRLARDIVGPWWGLVSATLFGLSPIVLAHGHYVTTDVAAAFGAILGTFYFIRYLKNPSREHLLKAVIALGIAELTKFSMVFLLPFFLILAVLAAWTTAPHWNRALARAFFAYIRTTFFLIFGAYLFLVYPTYSLFTLRYPSLKQQSDTEFLLSSFAGGPTPPRRFCTPMRCLADLTIAATKNPLTRPLAEYSLGLLMVTQRETGSNTNYFLGNVSASGTPWYFPVVYALKEPIPTLLLEIIAGILLCIFAIRKRHLFHTLPEFVAKNFGFCAALLFIVLYMGWSLRSNLNIGIRHIIPVIPFLSIITVWAWKRWLEQGSIERRIRPNALRHVGTATPRWILALFLGIWFLSETAFAAPYFLSYFNEFAGGTTNGYRFVTDSNYDWGQDWIRFFKWVYTQNNDNTPGDAISKIAIDRFGGGNPAYYLGNRAIIWSSAQGNPAAQGIHWLAVSVNTLQNAIQPTAKGYVRDPKDEYRWLTALRPPSPGMGNVPEPDYRIGTSILVYKL